MERDTLQQALQQAAQLQQRLERATRSLATQKL